MRAIVASLGLLALISAPLAPARAPGQAAQGPEAGETKQDFSIVAQPLSQALRAYAQQSGDQIVFYSELGRGQESASVQGRYTRDEALHKLLENTGLSYRRVNARTVAIGAGSPAPQRAARQGTSSAARLRLARAPTPVRTPAARRRADRSAATGSAPRSLFGVEEVVVTGTAVADRTKFESSVAISTFDSAEIAQQSPNSPADLIAAVPGFWVESTAGTTHGNVFARGIIQDGGYRYVGLMEDGLPLYPVFELSFYNPDQLVRVDATIQRVEAVRGGTAPIFTAGAIGGTVNFVTRQPTPTPEGMLELGIADYGMVRSDLSWTGPLAAGWGLAIGGYYRRSAGIRDPGYTADEGGQFRVRLSRAFERGRIDVYAKYIDDHSLFVVPLPLAGDPADPHGVGGADAGTYSLHSEDLARAALPVSAAEVGLRSSKLEDGIHPSVGTYGTKLEWLLGDFTTLENRLRYTQGEVRFDGLFPGSPPSRGVEFAAARGVAPAYSVLASGVPYPADGLVQSHGHWAVNKAYAAFQNDLRLSSLLGAHALTLGLYYADYSVADRWSLGNDLLMDASDRPRRLSLPGVTDPSGYTRYSTLNLIADYDALAYAPYLADEWQLTDALRVDLGMRYDSQRIRGSISAPSAQDTDVDLDGRAATQFDVATFAGRARRRVDQDFANFGWSLGLNYELTDTHAIFGHYTDAAKLPHFDDVRNGASRKDRVTNIELGYKASLERLVVFATLFQTEFDNVPFQDILASGATIVRRAQTRTRGIELEGEYRPLDALAIRFSLTRQAPEYRAFTGSDVDNTGNRIRRIPRVMGRITPTWLFLGDRARAYLTYTYAGARYANDENTLRLPSYATVDAGVMFDVAEHWTVQLSGDNLTDEVGLTEGNPRTDTGAQQVGPIYMARPLFGRSFTGSMIFRY
jgi:outer membrane receptor protein involved in Fe transport